MSRASAAAVLLALTIAPASLAAPDVPDVPPVREQHRIRQEWLKTRLE